MSPGSPGGVISIASSWMFLKVRLREPAQPAAITKFPHLALGSQPLIAAQTLTIVVMLPGGRSVDLRPHSYRISPVSFSLFYGAHRQGTMRKLPTKSK